MLEQPLSPEAERLLALLKEKANGAPPEAGQLLARHLQCRESIMLANADGSGLLIPSITRTGTPVILEVNRAGKASVVLESAANTPFESMIQAPDGHHGILVEIVPGDNNAWMIDNF